MNKTIKIAIFSGAVPSTTFIERLIKGLAVNGYQIVIFGFRNKKVSSVTNIHYFTYAGKLSKFFQLIKYSFLLSVFKFKDKKKLDAIIYNRKNNSRLLKLKYYPVLYHRPDIFHLQWAKGIEDWIWVKEFGIKLMLSLRGTHITISPNANEYWSDLYSHYFPKIDGFHAVSKSMIVEAQKYNVKKSKIKVIYSGLNLDNFHFFLKSNKIETLNIFSVGRSHWTKGYSYALDAMKLLKDKGTKFNYTIVGVKDDEELLYQRSQLDVEKEVTFINELPFEDVLTAMQKADVLLLSSVEEGIANVVLEAMAIGTFVISTDCGGMNEVIFDDKNGFIVPVRNSEAMALALEKVAQMPLSEYQKLTKAARVAIEHQHSSEKMIKDMSALYQNTLNS